MLGLDTPLTDYLPQPFIAGESRLKLITMRMVLSHTSGLPHGRKEGTALSLRSDPGKQFYYSATGFDYLQKVVQQLTKQSLTETMKRNVLQPLGLTHSNFGWLDQYESLAAQGYDEKGEPRPTFNEKYRRSNNEWRTAVAQLFPELSYPSAAAGLYATASDFAHYMLEMMAPSKQDEFHLSDSLWKEMLKPQVKVTDAVAWGLGWGLQHTKSGDAFWPWGNWGGAFQHFAVAFRENKNGVVIMTNSGNGLKLCPELVLKALNLDIAPLRIFLN